MQVHNLNPTLLQKAFFLLQFLQSIFVYMHHSLVCRHLTIILPTLIMTIFANNVPRSKHIEHEIGLSKISCSEVCSWPNFCIGKGYTIDENKAYAFSVCYNAYNTIEIASFWVGALHTYYMCKVDRKKIKRNLRNWNWVPVKNFNAIILWSLIWRSFL